MQIYIPTRGRVGNQRTLMNLPKRWLEFTTLVCPASEQVYHKMCRTIEGPEGIAPKRQFILEYAANEGGVALMLDDDMKFFRRAAPGDWHLLPATDQDMEDLLERMLRRIEEGSVAVGLSARQGNQHAINLEKEGGRMMNAYMVNATECMRLGFRFDTQPLMEDFNFTLQLLTNGYPNLMLYEWAWDQPGGSNTRGGCSSYRTPSLQELCARQLAATFPEFVTVVEKVSKNWKDMTTRYDVRVAWQKALNHGKERARNANDTRAQCQ